MIDQQHGRRGGEARSTATVNGHTVSEVIDALRRADCDPQQNGHGWQAHCPAHDDRNPSLSISPGDSGELLLHCHTGCGFMDIITTLFPAVAGNAARSARMRGVRRKVITPAANLATVARRITATYDYTDAAGVLLFQGVRYEPKDFRQRRPDGNGGWLWNLDGTTRVLYQLPHLATANAEAFIYLVEGEKDADCLRDLGLFATTSPAGAGKFHLADATPLHGHHVVVIADNDAPGRKHAEQVAALLHGKAASVRVLHLAGLPDHGDVSDWLDAGGDPVDLDTLADGTPEWTPPAASANTPGSQPPISYKQQQLSTTRMSDVTLRPIEWLWRHRLPVGVSVVAGMPDTGKTTVCIDLIARLTSGQPWPDRQPTSGPARAIVMTQEDELESVIGPRLVAAGGDLNMIEAVNFTENIDHTGQRTFSLAQDIDLLEDLLDRFGGVKVIFIDPLGAYIGGDCDTYRDNEVRSVLNPLVLLAKRRRISIIGLLHFRKAGSDHAMLRVLGSVAFVALARSVWAVVEDDTDKSQRLMLPVKLNLCKKPPGLRFQIKSKPIPDFAGIKDAEDPSYIEWLGESVADINEVLAPADLKPGPKGEKLDEAKVWLKAQYALDINVMAAGQLRKAADGQGISYSTLQRARNELGLLQWKTKEFGAETLWGWDKP